MKAKTWFIIWFMIFTFSYLFAIALQSFYLVIIFCISFAIGLVWGVIVAINGLITFTKMIREDIKRNNIIKDHYSEWQGMKKRYDKKRQLYDEQKKKHLESCENIRKRFFDKYY